MRPACRWHPSRASRRVGSADQGVGSDDGAWVDAIPAGGITRTTIRQGLAESTAPKSPSPILNHPGWRITSEHYVRSPATLTSMDELQLSRLSPISVWADARLKRLTETSNRPGEDLAVRQYRVRLAADLVTAVERRIEILASGEVCRYDASD